ncbi:NifS protein [Synechocystis sp. PCC 6803]|uniref:cysteine desulfurase n=1 Tax=Synechocystis sp. (strain ATCC 27184 / PCC 6803 / Kazusa) TaxID=1111708 RepID=Q55602_SYNY3|nr:MULTISPECIES: cysteine desulfurase family protein [unclassified Synechocystis]BAM54551.1 NifS protein [Synechocystis sp. PCC 6803] [Bacillus subtilis BEST7613]AGF52404.1 NifS protein [Synechocystis sp. PCC 6803]ALJ68342.1 cysteine desulfurase IscS [Synechocystis sp. PCC 6803]AVP90183.1 cysteine desulfurase [Synechocystis sp. IPPAS B-1465]MBD2619159.1 cysteine desulfurase [Synechocystis sp. FACHB-898]
MERPLYFDNHATTALDPRVLEAMLPYLTEQYGNAGSAHFYGWQASAAIKQARQEIAETMGAQPEEIIFTSGATEANNLAIRGVAEAYFAQGKHLVTVETEHQAVLAPCRYLETLGFEVTYLSVQSSGLVDLTELEKALRPDTILVSVMAANNEIGVLQPLKEIGALCRQRSIIFHCDGAQALGKIPLDVHQLNIDLLSFTGHKIHGPKGIGGLYRRQNPGVRLAPQLLGGGQEGNFRSGTLPVPLIVGLAKALTIAGETLVSEGDRQRQLRDQLWQGLAKISGVVLNGDYEQRLPGNLNVSITGVDPKALLTTLQPRLALSSGSACSSYRTEASHVLYALGRDKTSAQASLRFGLSRFTTEIEIDQAIAIVTDTVARLRADASNQS